jgi:hypothetical protein
MSYTTGLHFVSKGTDRDYPGGVPKTVFDGNERQQFEEVRERLDDALQVAGVSPFQPQAFQDPLKYELGLLNVLAKKVRHPMLSEQMPASDVARFRDKIINAVLAQPAREGRLCGVIKRDRAGREVHTFYGAKTWMRPFQANAQTSPLFDGNQPEPQVLRSRVVL